MTTPKFNVGTSGWSYKHWKDTFYPKGTKSQEYLKYYSEHFLTTEINSSFYNLPLQKTVNNWAANVPENFRFCPKMSKYITHLKKLKDVEEPLQRFFNVFDLIADKLGPVLIQLPKMVTFEIEKTTTFFEILKDIYRDYSFVLEVRHESWFTDESLSLMKKYDIGLVISQSGEKFPYLEAITSKNIYIRFHGPAELYASKYSDEMLADYASKCKGWMKKGHIIWAFFNNDIGGHAVDDAKRFEAMLG